MTASPFDSALYRPQFQHRDIGVLLSDTAEIRAILLTLGALATAQAAAGRIPDTSARAIQRAALEVQVDPGALAAQTAADGTPIPAIIAAFKSELGAPEFAVHLACDVTPDEVQATALALRLKQVVGKFDEALSKTPELGPRAAALATLTPGLIAVAPASDGSALTDSMRDGWAKGLGLAQAPKASALPAFGTWIADTTAQLDQTVPLIAVLTDLTAALAPILSGPMPMLRSTATLGQMCCALARALELNRP